MLCQRTVSYDPKRRRFEHVFGQSLRCRRLGKGVYRFRRIDGRRPDIVAGFVQISSPWCEEKVDGLAEICATHGSSVSVCPSGSLGCNIKKHVVKMNRWYATVQIGTTKYRNCFDVVLLRKRSLREGAHEDPSVVPADGAGFQVMIFSES